MTTHLQYEGYEITTRLLADGVGDVRVYHPRETIPILKTTSLDLAMRWVDAQRIGRRRLLPLGQCPSCDAWRTQPMFPSHDASDRCESGKHAHCTCDVCF